VSLRTLTIIETTVIKEGTSSAGKPWTLREVTAVGEHGEPIEAKLKTFDDLSGTVQVDIERQDDEKYGTALEARVDQLERPVASTGQPYGQPPPAKEPSF
jgi:hypothetical protein